MSKSDESFLIPSELKPTFKNNHLQYAITWFLMSFDGFLIDFLRPENFAKIDEKVFKNLEFFWELDVESILAPIFAISGPILAIC